jgi:structural maintenance of chromosome 1
VAKLADTEKEADKAWKDSKSARDQFNDVKRRKYLDSSTVLERYSHLATRCKLFNKAYNHISDRIDQVYKDLTKGKAPPMGGVAYLSLENSEVSLCSSQSIVQCKILLEQSSWLYP